MNVRITRNIWASGEFPEVDYGVSNCYNDNTKGNQELIGKTVTVINSKNGYLLCVDDKGKYLVTNIEWSEPVIIDLISEAKKRYPVGAKVTSIKDNASVRTSNGNFFMYQDDEVTMNEVTGISVYKKGVWSSKVEMPKVAATKNSPEEELRLEAIRRYPLGCRILPAHVDEKTEVGVGNLIVSHDFTHISATQVTLNYGDSVNNDSSYNTILYFNGKWAKIMSYSTTPKITPNSRLEDIRSKYAPSVSQDIKVDDWVTVLDTKNTRMFFNGRSIGKTFRMPIGAFDCSGNPIKDTFVGPNNEHQTNFLFSDLRRATAQEIKSLVDQEKGVKPMTSPWMPIEQSKGFVQHLGSIEDDMMHLVGAVGLGKSMQVRGIGSIMDEANGKIVMDCESRPLDYFHNSDGYKKKSVLLPNQISEDVDNIYSVSVKLKEPNKVVKF